MLTTPMLHMMTVALPINVNCPNSDCRRGRASGPLENVAAGMGADGGFVFDHAAAGPDVGGVDAHFVLMFVG